LSSTKRIMFVRVMVPPCPGSRGSWNTPLLPRRPPPRP